jgi:hypothetical protein
MKDPYSDPAPDVRWEIWYEDTFDRETPRAREASGVGLLSGLVELWSRHLREGLNDQGSATFSRFNLWWRQASRSVHISGDRQGAARLRGWIRSAHGAGEPSGGVKSSRQLLRLIAHVHSRLVLEKRECGPILEQARDAADPEDFSRRLAQLPPAPDDDRPV